MKLNILHLSDFQEGTASTIFDHASSFTKYSQHEIFNFNPVGVQKPNWLNLDKFDAIIIHYSVYIIGNNYINRSWKDAIINSRAIKIQFIQDEYRRINAFYDAMNELKIALLFTCVPEGEIEKVYPKEKLPLVTKVNNLTGYVPDYYENKVLDRSRKRSIDVGYRARGVGFFWLGKLFQEKAWIGEEFKKSVHEKDIVCDISNREEDRIYGNDWINFLENCKCTLGTESGANVFDFTGTLETDIALFCEQNPDASFDFVWNKYLKDIEGKIILNQISPRVFEAIGCGTVLVLFEGYYSGVLKPNIHYIPLKKDFSNIEEVCAKIKDQKLLDEMALTAYKDIISSGKYSYKTFVNFFDSTVNDFIKSRDELDRIQQEAQRRQTTYYKLANSIYGKIAKKIVNATIDQFIFFFRLDYRSWFLNKTFLGRCIRLLLVEIVDTIRKYYNWVYDTLKRITGKPQKSVYKLHPFFVEELKKLKKF